MACALLNNRTYAVPLANAFSPAAAWYFLFYLCYVFALAERKNVTQKEDEVPLRMMTFGPLRKTYY